ncbi:MAG: hypothetical protein WCR56_03660 [Bacilli bacterium]|jgi:hypothetical protein
MTKLRLFISLFLYSFTIYRCSSFYEEKEVGNLYIGYNTKIQEAFIGTIHFKPGESQDIVLPNKYDGLRIVDLGGFIGRGVPCSFCVSLNISAFCLETGKKYSTSESYLRTYPSVFGDEIVVHDYFFNITLPKYLLNFQDVIMDVTYRQYTDSDGKIKSEVFRPIYSLTISSDNPTFYTDKEGYLYYKETNEKVTEITYKDVIDP